MELEETIKYQKKDGKEIKQIKPITYNNQPIIILKEYNLKDCECRSQNDETQEYKSDFTQMEITASKPSNIIDFSSKLKTATKKKNAEIRKKSIERILKYAAELDW